VGFILLSGFLEKEILAQAINLGVSAALDKPVNFQILLSTSKFALKNYQLWKTLDKSLNTLTLQYQDIKEALQKVGREDLLEKFKESFRETIELKRSLRKS
jgi:AmiR/NasT family two-component response regulator